MKTFQRFNLITGWVIFLISTIVYLLTIEPTASFWDCGEFIATAFKQEVGHPPGAPLFMILGRIFTFFAGGNLSNVAVTVNIMSALSSSFTILFLFWTITHLARRIVITGEDFSLSKILSILGAGVVGALAYTFSDTFWFSAVEAEVYGTSSLFTAVVFWAILKWENVADEPHANRWLILIAYLIGLSIGIHLLNLLAIPAIVFVYYFKKYKPTTWGVIASLSISVAILGIIMYILIPGIVAVGARFDYLFVNGIGLPFHTGLLFYVILLTAVLVYLIYRSHKKRQVLWNTILLCFTVIAIGYSSYAVILMRSNANPPLDESDPQSAFSLLRYLNREQYGQNPLIYGNYFNTPPVEIIDGKPIYVQDKGKYVKMKQREYKYDPNFKGFFPRMWSEGGDSDHIGQYMNWANMREADLYSPRLDANGKPLVGSDGSIQFDREKPISKPTFTQNLRFFFRYQVGHMYLRYFMWNFAGRQNDIQGHGEVTKGNWISGINFIDEARLGPLDNLPDSMKNHRARNVYFFLPLILGLAGLYFQYQKQNKDFWVVTLLFVLTGLAIVVYLNQYPIQPRERDYAYAGSFYAFTIWIGLGVLGIIDLISKGYKSAVVVVGVTLATTILVPGLMASENWDDHDRSGRYTARDFAYDYLNSCEPNAILFTNGDNDTFPLWYLQEVEGVRTDVRVVNLSYLTADWYINQMKMKAYDSDPVPIKLTEPQYRQGTRDYAVFADNTMTLLQEKYNANRAALEKEYAQLYNDFMAVVEKSKAPQLVPKEVAELRKGYNSLGIETFAGAISSIERNAVFEVSAASIADIKTRANSFLRKVDQSYAPFKDVMNFFRSDDPRFQRGSYFFPAKKFVMEIDTARLIRDGVVKGDLVKGIVPELRWEVISRGLSKNGLIIMDLIETNNWERPIYFAITASRDNYLNLEQYLHREGLAYRLLPARGNQLDLFYGSVNTEIAFKNVMEKFRWGNITDPHTYLDENNLRMLTNFRYTFASLANALYEEHKPDSARKVLDKCFELIPDSKVPYNVSIVPLLQVYYFLGDTIKANSIAEVFGKTLDDELTYFRDIQMYSAAKYSSLTNDFQMDMSGLYQLYTMTASAGQTELADRIRKMLEKHDTQRAGFLRQ